MAESDKRKARKSKVLKAFLDCFSKHNQVIFVDLMSISTPQIKKIRHKLKPYNGTFLVGKNTITLLALRILSNTFKETDTQNARELAKKYPHKPELKELIPLIKDKVAFIFTDSPYVELKDLIEKEVIKVPAKVGIVAPSDIIVPAGQTTVDPGKFGEFQRLNIPTKTAKTALEIQKDTKICSAGTLVSETVSAMCRLLNIVPFEYGMKIDNVYLNGSFIPKSVIKLAPDAFTSSFSYTIRHVTGISIEAGIANSLSTPHMISNAFKSVLAIGAEAGIKLAILDQLSAAPAAAAPKEEKKEEKKETKKEVKKEEPVEEDMDLGGMFD